VRAYLQTERPNLLFVHLPDPDAAGHASGWMSSAYGQAVQAADAALGQLVAVVDAAYGAGNYSLLVTADHGGHAYGHGTNDPQDVTIPWIAWGRGVHTGLLKDASIRTFDTAPTVLWLLGVEEPDDWDGSPIVNAFQPRAMVTN
jgi:arylsulfatase A-like enzyme